MKKVLGVVVAVAFIAGVVSVVWGQKGWFGKKEPVVTPLVAVEPVYDANQSFVVNVVDFKNEIWRTPVVFKAPFGVKKEDVLFPEKMEVDDRFYLYGKPDVSFSKQGFFIEGAFKRKNGKAARKKFFFVPFASAERFFSLFTDNVAFGVVKADGTIMVNTFGSFEEMFEKRVKKFYDETGFEFGF